VIADAEFQFVGYLVQAPYLADARFPHARIATIHREMHPYFNRIEYQLIGGFHNPTEFLTDVPDMSKYQGWVLNGYAIDGPAIRPERCSDGTLVHSKYEYAKTWRRPADGLSLLGFDLTDESIPFFSVLHFEDYSVKEVDENGGPLNEFGLISSVAAARQFQRYVLEANQREGTIWQVWGDPIVGL
jgi:hypothetical protein